MRLAGAKYYLDKFVWRCEDRNCGGIQNIRKGNIFLETFAKTRVKILVIYIFTHFPFMIPASVSSKTLGLSLATVRNLANVLSSWIASFQIADEEAEGKFGGKGIVVEIDESCFFRRKHEKGRLQKQIWGFGCVERKTGRFFVEIVPQRNKKTLVPLIEKWIDKNSDLLLSDE